MEQLYLELSKVWNTYDDESKDRWVDILGLGNRDEVVEMFNNI